LHRQTSFLLKSVTERPKVLNAREKSQNKIKNKPDQMPDKKPENQAREEIRGIGVRNKG
jgi:hypothetical protein